MKLQLVLFKVTILMAVKAYTKALRQFSSFPLFNHQLSNSRPEHVFLARLHLFGRLPANVTDNNKMASPTSVTTGQDLARDLQGIAIAIMLLSFAILTIVVGEAARVWRGGINEQHEAPVRMESSLRFERGLVWMYNIR
jgi:hypothetical protein